VSDLIVHIRYPHSFDAGRHDAQINDTAHINLREEYTPWKHLVVGILLDKHKNLRTVVNKWDNINNGFRFCGMEVLARELDFVVDLGGSNCRFRFGF